MGLRRVLAFVAALAVAAALVTLGVPFYQRYRFEKDLPRYGGKTMPAFSLVDLEGRTWTQADLAGKTAFINVWATWCPPCRKEMPDLQAFWERVRSRPDVVLLTMNVDEDVPLVAPFVKEHGYTFPVLLARGFVRDQLKVQGIPRNWVLDGSLVWRTDQIGLPMTLRSWGSWAEARIAAASRPR